MRSAGFAYHAPRGLPEVHDLLQAAGGTARLLAGGQSLVPDMHARTVSPATVVDLRHVGLDTLDLGPDGELRIGAMVTQAHVLRSELVRVHAPLLVRATALVGYRATRTRGTVGGSVAHGDPRAELPVALLALDAVVVIAAPTGARLVPAAEFFAVPSAERLRHDDVVVEIRVPATAWPGHAFVELAPRHRGFALASAAVLLRGQSRITEARVAVGSLADRPLLLPGVSAKMTGMTRSELTGAWVSRVADSAVAELAPPSADFHATSDHRRRVGSQLLQRAIRAAAQTPEETRA